MTSKYVFAAVTTLAAAIVIPQPAFAGSTTRSSLSNAGGELNAESLGAAISGDGRYVGFVTAASGAVSGDTNAVADIFVRDRGARKTVRVSVSSGGTQANRPSEEPQLSRTGRYVVFTSTASSLVSGDTNGRSDIFVRDRDTDADRIFDEPGAVSTKRMSVATSGAQANGSSDRPAISANRYVAFASEASNLVANDTNGVSDVFVRDRSASRTVRISVSTSGGQNVDRSVSPVISSSGRFVAFITDIGGTASRVFVRDRDTDADGVFDEAGAVKTIRVPGDVIVYNPSISADGRHVTYNTTDQDERGTAFVHDLKTGRTVLVTVPENEAPLYDHEGETTRNALSGNGRYVTFDSRSDRLVSGDTNGTRDVFVRDRDTDADRIFDEPGAVRITRLSISSEGVQGNGFSVDSAIAENGAHLAFESEATNLSLGTDSNGVWDVFARTNP